MTSNNKPSPFQFGPINSATDSIFNSGNLKLKDVNVNTTVQNGAALPQFSRVIANTDELTVDGNITVNQTFDGSDLEADHTKKATDYYVMGSKHDPNKKRGRCVILGYECFKIQDPVTQQWSVVDAQTRQGNAFDVGALNATFQGLNFEVSGYLNLKTQETKDALINESQLNHSNYDCFVLCILSHGQYGKFQCSDSGWIEYEHVFALFDSDSLKDKPKLFFIEACLGGAINQGQGQSPPGHLNPPPVSNPVESNPNPVHFLPDNLFTKPLNADMFAFYATYPGFVSVSNPLKGSWFTQALCQVLIQYGDKEDLSTMVIKVNDKVSKEVCLHVAQMQPVKQMSHYLSTLTKEVKFY